MVISHELFKQMHSNKRAVTKQRVHIEAMQSPLSVGDFRKTLYAARPLAKKDPFVYKLLERLKKDGADNVGYSAD